MQRKQLGLLALRWDFPPYIITFFRVPLSFLQYRVEGLFFKARVTAIDLVVGGGEFFFGGEGEGKEGL